MKATETNLLQFLQNAKQFIIPIYQRTYSWDRRDCEQLWNDILRAGTRTDVSGHFVGSIVYIERGLYQISSVPELLVIDGQQRLTTIMLLLTALAEVLEKQPAEDPNLTPSRLRNYYLFNPQEEGELRYKLLLTRRDAEDLKYVLNGSHHLIKETSRIAENFQYFRDQIEKASTDVEALFLGIRKLIIVDIALDRDNDNPQLIFESLNSTGVALSQADLIRNYVLMGLEPDHQNRLYEEYWYPMEQAFEQTGSSDMFDRFMRHYLTVRTDQIPNINRVYESFKEYATGGKTGSIDDIVADVFRFAMYFVRIAVPTEKDPAIRAALQDINTLRIDVSYPFLLQVYEDWDQGVLDAAEVAEIARLVESFVFRRAICGIPTNALNRIFANLGREILPNRYVESLKVALLLKGASRRFPRDAEFRAEFVTKDVYNLTNRRNYLLEKLENFGRKEPVRVEDYTIEHILPQNPNLSAEWQEELGPKWREIQEQYLHTIGNLTLTGYNPELGDRSFREKRDMVGGFADSPIRLNHDLARRETWNEQAIKERAMKLADLAVKIWPSAEVPESAIEAYREDRRRQGERTYSLADHPFLTGDLMELFQMLRRRILNLDASVVEEILSLYIAYKTTTNFVDVVPRKDRLVLTLNMAFHEVHDPDGRCRDVTGLGRWGNGDVTVRIESPDDIEPVMNLVKQSFAKHSDDANWPESFD